ncbi:hypothetical protein BAE44_0015011 [Dichanthelium oligosanthes]|uniref:Uncharacterized protein n=1 Tax=Dichanthelium oligosanthes TaxID=888268 RepID=A0A1E5VFS7_9POAL|nr:hypothetical protein BAE44_0015011 [Dichanthelium oligosanthes]
MGSRVRALSVTHVIPAEASNPPPQDAEHATIKLSLFDTLCIALTPIQRLFFYEGDDLPPFPDLVRTLRSSLAATLAVYTPLAGRVTVSSSGDDVSIDCSPGTGVRFVEAEYAGTAADLRRLAGAAEHDAEAYAQLAPTLAVSALPAPALAVQVTRPAADCAGASGGVGAVVVVGVSMNHVVVDGQALWEFIRAWTSAARGGSAAGTGLVTPKFDRAEINRHPKAEEAARKFLRVFAPALPTVNTFPEPDNALQGRRTYLLSASQIRSLKHRISQHSKGADGDTSPAADKPSTTTYAAIASLVWTSGVRSKNALNHADDDAYLMFAADCRARLRPPLPSTFFGNCIKSCYAMATVGELRDGGGDEALARAAAAVREAVREQLADPLADAERWLERHLALPPDRIVQIGSSNRFAAYETDFGWGRPARVELASVFVREFVAVVGAPDGAVQVSVALDRDRMDGFEANFFDQQALSWSQAAACTMRSRVRVLNVAHVLPAPDQGAICSPDALPGDGHVKLSFMDALFVDRVPMQRLFFYEGPGVPPFPSLVRSLKSSLSSVLAVFRPLAGKLAHRASTGDVVVDCSPAAVSPGVKFVEAEYAGTIDDMRRLAVGDEHHTEALMLLGPELDAGRLPAPLLAVQVTRPANGGGRAVVVGVSIHHAVADGHSVWQFMGAWSAVSRSPQAASGLVAPTFDREVIPYPKSEEVARKILRTVAPALPVARSPSSYTPPDQRRTSFLLRADDIKSVKQRILKQSKAIGEQMDTHPSTYIAVSSLVWTSIVRAKSLDPAADAYFMVPADLRRRLGPPVDERYFGNCLAPCFARAAVRDLRDDGAGLARAAAAIGDAVRAQLRDPLGGADRWLEHFLAVPEERFTHTGSSNRFMAYETDFGWGAPSRVELVSLFTRELVLLLGAEDGGVQVTVALDHAHMAGFAANLLCGSRQGDKIPKPPIQRLFLYDGPDLPPFPSMVTSLQASLATTLAAFLPLAGKLAFRPDSGDVVLDCSPAAVSSGVKFVEAEISGGADEMRRLARVDEHDTEAFVQLVPEIDAARLPAPILAVQVTRPAGDGGAVAVGVTMLHAVADGHAVWQFMRAWSTAAREGSLASAGLPPPTFDRAGVRHPKADELIGMVSRVFAPALPLLWPRSSPSALDIPQQSRRTFVLCADEIQSLKQNIQQGIRTVTGVEPSKPPTTYVAISSLVWTSIVDAKAAMRDADDAYFMVSSDCRHRLRPPLGDGFFGNCILPFFARARASDLRGEAGAARAAVAIQDAIREHLEEPEEPLLGIERSLAVYLSIPPGALTAVGSSHRFMAYQTDFGWGAPRRVELASVFGGELVALLDSSAGCGGVQVSVALDRAVMETFVANFVVPASTSGTDE